MTIKRGESLPLKIRKAVTGKKILEASLKKHKAFNKRFNNKQKYKLAYRDGTEVVTIHGSCEEFTLQRYKEESGVTLSLVEVARTIQIHIDADETDLKKNIVDDS